MSRDPAQFLQDIVDACRKVQLLVLGHDLSTFAEDWRTRDAVLHNLEIVGEAVKRLPAEVKERFPAIPWKRIAGFRDVLAHAYFSIDDSIVWDVATHQVGPLLKTVAQVLFELDGKA